MLLFIPLSNKITPNLRHFSPIFPQNRLNLVALARSLFVHWIVLVPIFHRQRPQAAARTYSCISLPFPSSWNLWLLPFSHFQKMFHESIGCAAHGWKDVCLDFEEFPLATIFSMLLHQTRGCWAKVECWKCLETSSVGVWDSKTASYNFL